MRIFCSYSRVYYLSSSSGRRSAGIALSFLHLTVIQLLLQELHYLIRSASVEPVGIRSTPVAGSCTCQAATLHDWPSGSTFALLHIFGSHLSRELFIRYFFSLANAFNAYFSSLSPPVQEIVDYDAAGVLLASGSSRGLPLFETRFGNDSRDTWIASCAFLDILLSPRVPSERFQHNSEDIKSLVVLDIRS